MAKKDGFLVARDELAEINLPAKTTKDTASEAPDESTQGIVQGMIEEAINWKSENLEPAQAKATDYYHGRPFEDGSEVDGRSQVVSTDVRDSVQAILPSLIRVFLGPEQHVKYKERGKEDAAGAAQATDYIGYVVTEDNDGFITFYNAFKDALVRRQGIITWWWDDTPRTEEESFTGLGEDELMVLQDDEETEVTIDTAYKGPLGDFEAGVTYDVTVKRTIAQGIGRVAAIPNDEFIFSPNSRSLKEARLVGRIRELQAAELIAMGIDKTIVENAKGQAANSGDLVEARRTDEAGEEHEDEQPEATRPVRYVEAYVYLDVKGDGTSQLRKVCTVGDGYEIVENEGASDRPFAIFCPDPEPHTLVGLSTADYTMEIQRVKSAILRRSLDSLNLTLTPGTEVVEGEVNMHDIMNPETGHIIRVRRPGQMREIIHTPIIKDAFTMLAYQDERKENSLGISKAAAGLDADALQSSTRAAVAATVTGAQQHLELVARIFAETGMKDLFRGLLKLICKHQDFERVVRLRGEYVTIDPRTWDAMMDVSVNVALGVGQTEEKMQMLGAIVQKQEQLLSIGSPLVTNVEYRHTLALLSELAGYKNSEQFWVKWGPEEEKKYQEMLSQKQPQPDPTMLLVQVEAQKVQLEQQVKAAELELKRQDMMLKDDRERDAVARKTAIDKLKIEAEYSVKIQMSALSAVVASDRAAMDSDIKQREQERKDRAELQAAQAAAATGTEGE